MNYAKLIEAVEEIQSGLSKVLDVLHDAEVPSEEEQAVAVAVSNLNEVAEEDRDMAIPVEIAKPAQKPKGEVNKASLDKMGYNDLKKYAKMVGVSAVGSRDEITDRILSGEVEEPEEEEAPELTDEGEDLANQEADALEEVDTTIGEEEIEEDADEPKELSIRDRVIDMCDGRTEEELADLLVSAKISASGKRQALIDKIIKAVEQGSITLDDDEDETEDEPEDETEEISVNDFDNPDMTAKRKKAITKLYNEISESSGEFERKECEKYLKAFYNTSDSLSEYSDEEILEMYADCKAMFIDDDGKTVGLKEAYNVNDVPYCCGKELDYDDKKNTFTCAECKTVYRAE